MQIHVNGNLRECPGPLTVTELITSLGMKSDRVAVELNRDILPRDRWAATQLAEGDQLEIVHFVGGGAPAPSPSVLK
jgi:thiamine biosynthesis protein ThiS